MTAAPFTRAQAARLYIDMPLEHKQEFRDFYAFYAVLQWFEGVHNIGVIPAALPSPDWCAEVDAELAATAVEDAASQGGELWLVVEQTVVPCGDERPLLGYLLLDDFPPFASFEEAAAFISSMGLPLGWVAKQFQAPATTTATAATPARPPHPQELAAFGALLDGDSLEQAS